MPLGLFISHYTMKDVRPLLTHTQVAFPLLFVAFLVVMPSLAPRETVLSSLTRAFYDLRALQRALPCQTLYIYKEQGRSRTTERDGY